jgi:hypothetical protein
MADISLLFAGEEKTGVAGFYFLKLPVTARETALGMSGLTSSGVSAVYWNPANISSAEGVNFMFSHLDHFADINAEFVGFSLPVEGMGTFALSLNVLRWGEIEETTERNPEGTGATFSPIDMAFGVSYSRQITDRVSGGMTIKYITSKIAAVSATGVAFDFGFSYNTGYKGLKLGFAATNLGVQSRYDGDGLQEELQIDPSNQDITLRFASEPFELPASVNFGLSVDLYRSEQSSVIGMAEQNINNLQSDRTNFGVEYGFKDMFFVRGGYTSTFRKDVDVWGKAGTFTAGVGVQYKVSESRNLAIDYSYMDQKILDASHRFTVSFGF